jgi:hypothetical protein
MNEIGWQLVAHEWDVYPGRNDHGKGDLVFKKHNQYLVLECKRKNGPKVYEQAQFYASAWSINHVHEPHIVIYGVWTYHHQEIIGTIRTFHEAHSSCCRQHCASIIASMDHKK